MRIMEARKHHAMGRRSTRFCRWAAALFAALHALPCSAHENGLEIEVDLQAGNAPLAFDVPSLTNATGQAFSITRLDFLLSDFELRRPDGIWVVLTNNYACVRGRERRTAFRVDAPDGMYDAIRYRIGVAPSVNHVDPSVYPADHPLNPNVNGLHWDWAGGYIFFALEGLWDDNAGERHGFSFHVANDPQVMVVEHTASLTVPSIASLIIRLDVDRILDEVALVPGQASTHSREGDALAGRLARAIVDATSATLGPIHQTAISPARLRKRGPILYGTAAGTPYRFTFPSSFPMPNLPRDNPLTVEGVDLGRRLFNDTLLSGNGRQSCASCHLQPAAFSHPGMRFSPGAEGQPGPRNTMPIFNLAWRNSFFWDGRVTALREQPRVPIESPIEMHDTMDNVVQKLAAHAEYPALFAAAFGSEYINADRVGLALEQFMLAQVAGASRFDRALNGEDLLTEEEKRGFQLFSTEFDPRHGQAGADCFHCHGGPLFVNKDFANNGLDATFTDKGRFDATRAPGDEGKFAVPSLRNVALTPPYMHDGRFTTLEEVVEHYATGIRRSPTLDPNIAKHPDGGVPLSDEDKKALVAFLKTLTDENPSPPQPVP
jgi:cytochrome c peroxidase